MDNKDSLPHSDGFHNILWQAFRQNGSPGYYMLMKALQEPEGD